MRSCTGATPNEETDMKTRCTQTVDLNAVPPSIQNVMAAQLFNCISKAFESEDVQLQYRQWKEQRIRKENT